MPTCVLEQCCGLDQQRGNALTAQSVCSREIEIGFPDQILKWSIGGILCSNHAKPAVTPLSRLCSCFELPLIYFRPIRLSRVL